MRSMLVAILTVLFIAAVVWIAAALIGAAPTGPDCVVVDGVSSCAPGRPIR